ncbi:MAG: leucine-rich repeat domain-containing protein [Clostridiales bacterium]|nr:leucine-rich repeat domain-containing protein [Clostridiales bacterium]
MDAAKFKEIFSKDNYRLPIRWDGKDFYATLYKHLKNYREDIKSHCSEGSELFDDVKTVCRGICAAVDCSFRGYPEKAYDSFKGVMEILGKDPLLIDEKDVKKESLYRVVDVENAAVPDRKRLFHVPFSMRSKMSTQRYSIPGFPSLYLGTSLELCCMEVGKDPQRDYVCVSRYELQTDERVKYNVFGQNQRPIFDNDEFKIYDISIKPDNAINKSGNKNKDVDIYIKWYPLISACSYIRAMRDDHYSAEYIIPQLFIQWVRSENEDAVVGIKYFSCASEHASILGHNYVFPTTGTPYQARKTITNYCARLSHRFMLTVPEFIMDYCSIENCEEQIKADNNLEYIEGYNEGEGEEIEGEYEIPEGVSAIGVFAFSGCSALTGITIPDSVTSIGDFAFSDCSALPTITIPDSVTSIGNFAFDGCSALTTIIIPKSVTNIGNAAFDCCSALTTIIIPKSVTSISNTAFSRCNSLSSIIVDIKNEHYTSVDNIIYNKDKTILICYPAGKNQNGFTIPDNVTSIGDYAFDGCSALITITIPDSVTSIGDYAFSDCSALTTITIPDSVTSIGNFAFDGCSALTTITISDSVTSIGNFAFSYCSSLTSIIIPDSVTSIGEAAFLGCSALKTVNYSGTREQRERLNNNIGEGNEVLMKAEWIYNSSGSEN